MTTGLNVDSLLEDACRTLLPTRGYALQLASKPSGRAADGPMFYVVLGFAGEHVRGNVVLEAPRAWLAESHPSGNTVSVTGLMDWAGEFTNQLLGRIKNRCAGLGVNLSLGIPTVVTGHEVSLYSSQPGLRSVLWFQCGAHVMGVSLELELDEALLKAPIHSVEVMAEGDLMIF